MYSFQNNQLILDKWAKRAHIRKEGEISPDGVYYKGSRYHFESNGKIFCERERGDEDALWNNSLRRILFIIAKTKSTFLQNEKYIFQDFQPFPTRLFDNRLIAA